MFGLFTNFKLKRPKMRGNFWCKLSPNDSSLVCSSALQYFLQFLADGSLLCTALRPEAVPLPDRVAAVRPPPGRTLRPQLLPAALQGLPRLFLRADAPRAVGSALPGVSALHSGRRDETLSRAIKAG